MANDQEEISSKDAAYEDDPFFENELKQLVDFPDTLESFQAGKTFSEQEARILDESLEKPDNAKSEASSTSQKAIPVNPKQYRRILLRRQTRLRLRQRMGVPTDGEKLNNSTTYIHKSRHDQAVKRERGHKGQFVSSKKAKNNE